MPPKKKGIKEPDVVVPAGDAKIGKSIFDELCASCHGLEVFDK
jgi:mono/diheme cytochrome c family protein